VYFTYGMHFCMNLVCQPAGVASAVLLRAGEVVAGTETAAARRPNSTARDLARGPARMCQALGIDRRHNGIDVTRRTAAVSVRGGAAVADDQVETGPRVGIAAAADLPWRLWIDADPTVSVYRPHVRRARRR
jgi:DNA-3-methyladenine glycosylase